MFCVPSNFQSEMKLNRADLIEREVRDIVSGYYKKLDGVAVLIICGIDMLNLEGPKGQNIQEIDFLIINYSQNYILNIEVKRSLTNALTGGKKNKITVIKQATDQIDRIKRSYQNTHPTHPYPPSPTPTHPHPPLNIPKGYPFTHFN